jgi:dimethylglycine dehydrogenase
MGELGWELHHPMKQMEYLYDAIYEVGKKDNISNFGTYAVNSLRMENAYRGCGAELTGEISLGEAGMYRFFNLNKKSNFIGSEVIRKKLQSGVDIKIVYLELDVNDADARGNEPVYHNNKIIGVVTSGAYGFRVNKSLAFAYIQSELAKDETELLVEVQGQKRKAKILNTPAYDPQNKKLKS